MIEIAAEIKNVKQSFDCFGSCSASLSFEKASVTDVPNSIQYNKSIMCGRTSSRQ